MQTGVEFWIAFNAGVLVLLALDLFVFNRKNEPVGFRKAVLWSMVWVALSLSFNAVVWHWKGSEKALEFLAGYLIEYSLSVDNLFVFVLIFSTFKVRPEHQHRVLFWGILGALIMRGAMIFLGVGLILKFQWMLLVFGAFLLFTGIRMFFGEEEVETENALVRFFRRWIPVTPGFHGSKFFVRIDGRLAMTPLALVLAVVETGDLLFALDSIPAVIAITQDPFIVYTSNICAILGLRALYFVLAHVAARFVYLKYGIAMILIFIGIKMLIARWVHIPVSISLCFIATCLAAAIVISVVATRKK